MRPLTYRESVIAHLWCIGALAASLAASLAIETAREALAWLERD